MGHPINSNATLPSTPSKQFPLLPAILSIIVLLSLSSTAYLGYQNMQLTKQIEELSKPLPTPTPTTNPTANWKLYTNDTYGFSFKYPNSLTISNYYDQNTGLPVKSVLFGFEFKNANGVTLDTFTIYDSGTSTVENWIKLNRKTIIPVDSPNPVRQSINSLDIYKISNQYGTFYVFSNNNNRIFLFGITGNDALADQILSTFTFLGQQTPTPKDVQGYTCPSTEYVDCMPGPASDGIKWECTQEYLTWATSNCPDFKGGAL